jgi:hypothetical protein
MWPDLSTYPAYLSVSQYGQFQRFSIPITKWNSAGRRIKPHLFVCLHSFAFPHHNCPVTAHTVLYVTRLVPFLSNNLSTNYVLGPQTPQHFAVSAHNIFMTFRCRQLSTVTQAICLRKGLELSKHPRWLPKNSNWRRKPSPKFWLLILIHNQVLRLAM